MLDSYGKPVLADFGVASKVGQLEVGAFDGFSVLWAPPEQQDVNSPASPLQDVWALAATTWTFVTGRSPFEDPIGDNSAASIANRVQRGRMRGLGRADAPAELERVLRAAMMIDPAERTPSAMEFGQGLQRVQKELGLPRTEMEIKEKRSKASAPTAGDQKTRLRGAPVIDPDKTRLRSNSYSFEGGAGSGGVEAVADSWKIERSADADEVSARRVVEDPSAAKKGMSPVAGVLLALLAAVIAAGLIVGMLRGQGSFTRISPAPETTSASSAPGDALGAAPPQVSGLSGEYSDGMVTWTWTAPDGPSPQDILYAYEGSGAAGTSRGRVESTSVTVDGASGQNCIEITTVSRSSGRMSDPVQACVEAP